MLAYALIRYHYIIKVNFLVISSESKKSPTLLELECDLWLHEIIPNFIRFLHMIYFEYLLTPISKTNFAIKIKINVTKV